MRLIRNWREGWKFWSVRLDVIGLALLGAIEAFPNAAYHAWAAMPSAMRDHMGTDVIQWAAYVSIAAGIIARFIKQRNINDSDS